MEYIEAKSIVSNYTEDKFWFGKNYNLNIYKGCSHGCIYCDSRSDCYQIENFDEIKVKKDAINIIARELKSKRKKGVVDTGGMSDPYNPFEKKLKLTRGALIEINKNRFGVGITTKSKLITRDIDILKQIKEHSPIINRITITTYNDDLGKLIEPNVCLSSERFNAVEKLSIEGLYTGIMLTPILPFINDTEENIINVIRRAKECGARFIYNYGFGVTLRSNQREYFYEQLIRKFPNEALVKIYKEQYGNSYMCYSINNKKLNYVFKNECEKLGLIYKMPEIIEDYKRKYEDNQISWF